MKRKIFIVLLISLILFFPSGILRAISPSCHHCETGIDPCPWAAWVYCCHPYAFKEVETASFLMLFISFLTLGIIQSLQWGYNQSLYRPPR